jgi:hypothetical protein
MKQPGAQPPSQQQVMASGLPSSYSFGVLFIFVNPLPQFSFFSSKRKKQCMVSSHIVHVAINKVINKKAKTVIIAICIFRGQKDKSHSSYPSKKKTTKYTAMLKEKLFSP